MIIEFNSARDLHNMYRFQGTSELSSSRNLLILFLRPLEDGCLDNNVGIIEGVVLSYCSLLPDGARSSFEKSLNDSRLNLRDDHR